MTNQQLIKAYAINIRAAIKATHKASKAARSADILPLMDKRSELIKFAR